MLRLEKRAWRREKWCQTLIIQIFAEFAGLKIKIRLERPQAKALAAVVVTQCRALCQRSVGVVKISTSIVFESLRAVLLTSVEWEITSEVTLSFLLSFVAEHTEMNPTRLCPWPSRAALVKSFLCLENASRYVYDGICLQSACEKQMERCEMHSLE